MVVGGDQAFTIGTTATQVIGYSDARKSITFNPPANNRVTITSRALPTLDAGPTLQQSQAPLHYSREQFGDMVSGPFFAIANVAGVVVGYAESFDYE